VIAALRGLLSGYRYPRVSTLLAQLQQECARLDEPCPSRATVYKFMRRDPGKLYLFDELPARVRQALYNQQAGAAVPGAQLAFYCFNYGDLSAVHFASALPWLPLYQAARMRGWRSRSRGLLRAVNVSRRIPDG